MSGSITGNMLTFKVQDFKDAHVVAVKGECDMSTAPMLKDVMQSLITPASGKPAFIIADVRNLSYMDSSAFWVLAAANRKAGKAGGGVTLVADTDQPITRVIRLLKLDRLMGVHSTLEEALAYFHVPRENADLSNGKNV